MQETQEKALAVDARPLEKELLADILVALQKKLTQTGHYAACQDRCYLFQSCLMSGGYSNISPELQEMAKI